MTTQGPPIMFRPQLFIIEILKAVGKEKGISENLVAKFFMLDHMINLKLIPKKLIPQLLKDSNKDYFNDIQKSYGFTDLEMQQLKNKIRQNA